MTHCRPLLCSSNLSSKEANHLCFILSTLKYVYERKTTQKTTTYKQQRELLKRTNKSAKTAISNCIVKTKRTFSVIHGKHFKAVISVPIIYVFILFYTNIFSRHGPLFIIPSLCSNFSAHFPLLYVFLIINTILQLF